MISRRSSSVSSFVGSVASFCVSTVFRTKFFGSAVTTILSSSPANASSPSAATFLRSGIADRTPIRISNSRFATSSASFCFFFSRARASARARSASLVGASRFKSSTLAATFAETFLFFKPNVLSAASCAFRSFRSFSFSRFSFSSLRFFSSAVRRFSPSTFFGGMAIEIRQSRVAPRFVRPLARRSRDDRGARDRARERSSARRDDARAARVSLCGRRRAPSRSRSPRPAERLERHRAIVHELPKR